MLKLYRKSKLNKSYFPYLKGPRFAETNRGPRVTARRNIICNVIFASRGLNDYEQ